MKTAIFIAAALLATSSAVNAADLAPKPYTKAPAYGSPAYDWSGFYLGANAGYGTAHLCSFEAEAGDSADLGCSNVNGAVVGGQIGYRWQFNSWIVGVEGQGDWTNMRGFHSIGLGIDDGLTSFGFITAQIGHAWDNLLIYGKGGVSIRSVTHDERNADDPSIITPTTEKAFVAGTVGGGVEYGLAANWSVGADYSHIFSDSIKRPLLRPAGSSTEIDGVRGDIDIVTARLNYHFK
jgi:outer membrane immunogenic protein